MLCFLHRTFLTDPTTLVLPCWTPSVTDSQHLRAICPHLPFPFPSHARNWRNKHDQDLVPAPEELRIWWDLISWALMILNRKDPLLAGSFKKPILEVMTNGPLTLGAGERGDRGWKHSLPAPTGGSEHVNLVSVSSSSDYYNQPPSILRAHVLSFQLKHN